MARQVSILLAGAPLPESAIAAHCQGAWFALKARAPCRHLSTKKAQNGTLLHHSGTVLLSKAGADWSPFKKAATDLQKLRHSRLGCRLSSRLGCRLSSRLGCRCPCGLPGWLFPCRRRRGSSCLQCATKRAERRCRLMNTVSVAAFSGHGKDDMMYLHTVAVTATGKACNR